MFKWNSIASSLYSFDREETQFGLFAQDVMDSFPELIKHAEDGYLRVKYSALVPILVEAVNEIQDEMKLNEDKMKEEMKLNEDKMKEEMKLNEDKMKEEMKLNEDKMKDEMKLNEDKMKEEMLELHRTINHICRLVAGGLGCLIFIGLCVSWQFYLKFKIQEIVSKNGRFGVFQKNVEFCEREDQVVELSETI